MVKKKSEKVPLKNTKPTKETSRGLGDTVEKFTKATGIKKIVEWLSDGKDCGCDRRREYLNKMFPYKETECLLESEYYFLDSYYSVVKNEVSPDDQNKMIKIYNRVFNEGAVPTSCSPCFKNNIHNQLKKVYDQYKSDKEQE